MAEILPTRVFTRDDQCTKVHIWNCFITPGGLKRVAVVHSRSKIGLNTPKYLKREAYVDVVNEKGVEYYQLTAEGEKWLRDGLIRHLEIHPDQVPDVEHYLQLVGKPVRAKRVSRSSSAK